MAKNKFGLHKEVTSIFDGVPLPQRGQPHESSQMSTSGRTGYVPPRPVIPTPQPQQYQESPKPKENLKPMTKLRKPKTEASIKTKAKMPLNQTIQAIKNKLFAEKPGVDPARQKLMTVLVPVLFVVLIVVFFKVFKTPAPNVVPAAGLGPAVASAVTKTQTEWEMPPIYPPTLRDPMKIRPVVDTQEGSNLLLVTGIVLSENPSAIVSNQIVHEGDKILDATIIKISKNSVVFEAKGKTWTQQVQR